MSLPPLPLIDGKLLIDNSTLEVFQTCPRAMQYSYLHRKTIAADRPALNFGGGLHEALKTRYTLCKGSAPDDAACACINATIAKHFEDHPQPPDDYRTMEYAALTMQGYNSVYGKEPFDIINGPKGPLVEASFSHELGMVHQIPVVYTGRIDLCLVDDNGEWVMDHKTSSMFGASFDDEMATTAQLIGYCWAFQQTFGRKPAGYYVNAIRTRPPTKAEEIAKTYGGTAARTDNFKRLYWHVSNEAIAEWRADTLSIIANFVSQHDAGFFPRHKKWCVGKYGRCQYYDVCTIPQEKREWALGTTMFTDNEWTPLTKPQQQTTKET